MLTVSVASCAKLIFVAMQANRMNRNIVVLFLKSILVFYLIGLVNIDIFEEYLETFRVPEN